MESLKNKKVIIPIIIAIVIILIGVLSLILSRNGKLELIIDEEAKNGITFNRIIPMNDIQGLGTKEYTFSVTNNSKKSKTYSIYLDDAKIPSSQKRMNDSNIRYSLTKNGSDENPKELTELGKNPNRLIDSDSIDSDKIISYTLKIWLKKDISEDDMMTTFKAKLRLEEIDK